MLPSTLYIMWLIQLQSLKLLRQNRLGGDTISRKYIEDIYFFEVNTKYISSSVLKTSEFSWVRSTNENFDVFNSLDEIYLVFTNKK